MEIPSALMRKAEDPTFPVVPLFVDYRPDKHREAFRSALGDAADGFLECNGVIRGRQGPEDFRQAVAARYVRDSLRSSLQRFEPDQRVRVLARALSEPHHDGEIVFDWRGLIDPLRRRLLVDPSVLRLALTNAKEAMQSCMASPLVELDLDLPLPLAFLVGYEWRSTSRVHLILKQRTGASLLDVDVDGEVERVSAPIRTELSDAGPVVVAVAARQRFGAAALRYAREVGARRLVEFHEGGFLSPPQIRALARSAADELRAANNEGFEKHLLLLGPSALAVVAGASSNACGPIVLPFWDGNEYSDSLVVAGRETTGS